jgi:serine/threonine-protein kinase
MTVPRSERLSVSGLTLGQYKIGERIGSGGMATVYRGVQSSLNREVAIKVLPVQFSGDPSFVDRFKQEAESVANLRHPNILTVFDFGEQNGIIYMVTEFVGGGTLADRLGTPMPLEQVLAVMGPLASALDFAHQHGIVHRDLKPANVLLMPSGEPILSDFGLARLLQSGGRLTNTGSALGTPEYMAPEQAMGADVSAQTDIYAFGVLLYEMLTGQVPFPGETPVAIILAHLHQPPPPPRGLVPSISEPAEAVVLKCLAKDPPERYETAREVIRALEASLRPSQRLSEAVLPARKVPAAAAASLDPDEAHRTLEYGELRIDLGSEKLMWNGNGAERARELLMQRLERLKEEGWELVGSIRDPGVLHQGASLRGPTIRGATLFLRRFRD